MHANALCAPHDALKRLGVPAEPAPGMFTDELGAVGWEYRGNARDKGGLVFVRETRPLRRVAHIHLVRLGGPQWRNYLALRELLRTDPEALARYEAEKRSLSERFPFDRKAYQAGKNTIVGSLLRGRASG